MKKNLFLGMTLGMACLQKFIPEMQADLLFSEQVSL